MNCRTKKAKKIFPTRADAERAVRKANNRGWHLYAYACGDHFHLATVKKAPKLAEMTNAEWKHIKNRVADLGKRLVNEETRAARKRVRELAPVIEADREWLRRIKDSAEFHEACARALRQIVDEHFRRNP